MKRKSLSTLDGPMTPLFLNLEFPSALEATHFIKWNRSDNTRIVQILVEGKLPQLAELVHEHGQKWMQYCQLYTYIRSSLQISLIDRPLTNFEQILLQEQKLNHNFQLYIRFYSLLGLWRK